MNLLNSLWLRPALFLTLLTVLGACEVVWPRRTLTQIKRSRWGANLALTFFNGLILRFIIPLSLVSIASRAQELGIGLLNLFSLSPSLELILSLFFLDFFIYLQHVATHKFSFLWKFHQVHHADLDLDVSSGTRFHTIEIVLSLCYKTLIILLIGPSALSVILFEIILNSMAMFNHSNINLPVVVDKYLRLLVVTPDMHRVHHSSDHREHNRNFGFNLSVWDFLFQTYQDFPKLGQLKMEIGLTYFRDAKLISPLSLVKMPFIKKN